MSDERPKVWNARRPQEIPAGAVLVDRTTKWGNPIRLEDERDRAKVLSEYEAWLDTQPELKAQARAELRGKHLVCWCAPKACHADILMKAANDPDAHDRDRRSRLRVGEPHELEKL